VTLASPEVAVTLAVPLATDVMSPASDTVATDGDDEVHIMVGPLITVPCWSLTVADSCCVAPRDEKLDVVADSVIEVATGIGGTPGVVPLSSPHATSKSSAVSRRGRILNNTL